MRSIGIVRKVDELGRVVLPRELRRVLGINEKDAIEIYVEGSRIILEKYDPSCIFCGTHENLMDFQDKSICTSCQNDLRMLAE